MPTTQEIIKEFPYTGISLLQHYKWSDYQNGQIIRYGISTEGRPSIITPDGCNLAHDEVMYVPESQVVNRAVLYLLESRPNNLAEFHHELIYQHHEPSLFIRIQPLDTYFEWNVQMFYYADSDSSGLQLNHLTGIANLTSFVQKTYREPMLHGVHVLLSQRDLA